MLATELLGKMSLLGSCRRVIVDVSVSLAIPQLPHERRNRVAKMKGHLQVPELSGVLQSLKQLDVRGIIFRTGRQLRGAVGQINLGFR